MSQTPEQAFKKLTDIVNTLMGENGCPWDRVQTRESLKPYLVEEAYETLEALDGNNPEKIKDELGDLLYQILFHSKIAENQKEFDITQVIDNLSEKMVRRHPHVFEDSTAETPDAVVDQWEHIKKSEKANQDHQSVLDSVPKHMPALARAQKLSKKAAKHGFDWQELQDVFHKLDEEIAEFKEAVLEGKDGEIEGELGDILFVLVNLARHKKIDAEEALRNTNNKFIERFQYVEEKVKQSGKTLKETSLDEMERYWQEAKRRPGKARS
ncbi:MAG: nucleoside triphosphate pyrophosphohydrolase [Nitrospinaceae bacterium]|nr:nucleoside triphosphate pyrophosphohydrolase [Nitrospinaceae bacterium]NIR56226.1 nucleoside triphosphate pyrophosphohydrolase [Nitrospinaceae bacterium]NIS86682.1 nucleoside triphosphate pyrophosphohydrolase [Nitrospinaceae bacterium]NIT83515.1 nucleoside triphosphate pyrophosphohydrolase [Nitrospinaceae bacterium]NIU45720.1 nucleoside triphosphate pyrophosphohydrolase [Nitrospinaceae bacterium]